jgi:hypothetical protein
MFAGFGRYVRQHHIGLLALFVALGGTSYATLSVSGRNVQDGSLTGADVRNGSLAPADLSAAARDARRRGRRGARGRRGSPGPAGPPGVPGPAGATNVTVRVSPPPPAGGPCPPSECPGGTVDVEAQASCLPGERATGGGIQPPGDAVVTATRPILAAGTLTPIGWIGTAEATVEPGGVAQFPIAYVICAAP